MGLFDVKIKFRYKNPFTGPLNNMASLLGQNSDSVTIRDVNWIFSFFDVYAVPVILKLFDQPVYNLVENDSFAYRYRMWKQFTKQKSKNLNRYRVKTKASKWNHLFCFLLSFWLHLFIFFTKSRLNLLETSIYICKNVSTVYQFIKLFSSALSDIAK
jgi:hypothetical protein